MRLNQISDNAGARKARTRIGRGIGSGKGKTGGRGGKGQTARSGVRIKGFEGGQNPIYRRLPKRGFNNPFPEYFEEVNVGMLQAAVDAGRIDASKPVNKAALVAAGIIHGNRDGVRLLGDGEIKAKLTIDVCGATKAAKAAVEKAGGSVTVKEAPAPKAKKSAAKK